MTIVADETRRYAATTDKKWDGSASRFTDEQYQRSCLIDRGGDAPVKERCSLPVLEPDGTINTNALGAALGRLGSLKDVTDAMVSRAKSKLRSLYKTAGLDVPDSLAMSDDLPRHELLVTLGELETVDVDGIEILSAGGPYFGTGSPPEGDTFDVSFLQELAEAGNALSDQVKPPIKIGHSKTQKLLRNSGLSSRVDLADDEQPAAGWLENFRVAGDKLLADAKDVPRKIADLMKSKAFRSRSVEMARVTEQTSDGAGRVFDSVVTALALLGAKAPAVRTLDDILAWYGERGTAAELFLADEEAEPDEVERTFAVGDVVWDPEQGAQDFMADLCSALNGPPGSTGDVPMGVNSYWVRDVAMTGNRALVQRGYGDDADAWVVPFSVVDGDPVPAPSSEWTLAAQKWLQASVEAMSDASGGRVAFASPGADTSGMAETTTAPAELSDEQIAALATTFSITEDDPAKRREAVLASIKSYAGETPAPPTPPDPGEPTPPAPPTPPEPQAAETPELAALRRSAELGERAFEERRVERRDATIGLAIYQGRIDPADKDKWVRHFDQNEELAVEALASIPPQPRRTFGSDDPGRVDASQQIATGIDRAYADLSGRLGITPYSLVPANGGQS